MPIIEWADWQAAQANIAAANQQVSGMTPAEAKAALKFVESGTQNGSGLQVVNSQTASPSGSNVIQFPNSSASQAAGDYVSAGGTTSAGGAATSGGNVVQTNNLTMTQKAGGVTGVAGLLAMNLPTAAAAIAPIAGVALGAGLYSLNPDLWEKISRALLPFCYNDTELLPVVADENGTTYYPQEAIDAVKSVINENIVYEGTDVSTFPNLSSQIDPFPFPFYISQYTSFEPSGGRTWALETTIPVATAYVRVRPGVYPNVLLASESPFEYRLYDTLFPNAEFDKSVEKEINGKTIYSADFTSTVLNLAHGVQSSTLTNADTSRTVFPQIQYTMIYGYSTKDQEGLSGWSGPKYPINPEGIGVINRIDDSGLYTVSPYYPITTPVGEPGVSVNPTEVPDLTKNTEVAPAIGPWITTSPDPNTYPNGYPQSNPAQLPNNVPGTDPNLDPNTDPSQAPEPQPDPDPDPAGKKPGDTGTSPAPQIPLIPVLPSAATGLLHVYNPTQSQLDAFGAWLWTTFSGDLIDTLSKLFNNPMDAVIGLHELYASPAISGSSTIRAGYLDSNVPSNLVGERYTSINCGSIVVQEYYQNYLDYSPYTKCYIYLPFIGIVPVLADDIVGNAVNVTYNIDSYTGCCIAIVTVAREEYSSTVYQFEGNCAVEIPITSGYQSTLMGALIGIGATALTGNPHAGIAAANLGRASLGKNDVSHSGSFGSSYGAMGAKTPYIIVKRPTQKSVVNYNQEYGFPAHKRVTIGACSGYLRAREVHVISPTATDEEKARIEELLKSGVFVK